jgi:hypothetical protein
MEKQTSIKEQLLSKFATQFAIFSFGIGTLLLTTYLLIPNLEWILLIGFYYLLLAICLNSILIFYLLINLLITSNKYLVFLQIVIVLSNIPIAFLYYCIVMNHFGL